MKSPAALRTRFARSVAARPIDHGLRWISLSVVLLSLLSCGGQSGPKLPTKKACVKVEGQVRVDGEPAEGVQIILHPKDENHGLHQFPMGLTNANGEFKLGTYTKEDGAPKGNYVAVFVWPIPLEQEADDDDRLKRLYSDPHNSTFKVTIDGAQSKLESFDLKLKGLEGTPLKPTELKELKFQQKRAKMGKSS